MKTLDLAILEADRNAAMMASDEEASVVVEAMLPHKQILRDRLNDLGTQTRMEIYNH